MSYAPNEALADQVDQFLRLLSDLGIDIEAGLPTEDALAVQSVIEYWRRGAGAELEDPRGLLRSAMGFADFAGRVLDVKQHPDFAQLVPHLKLAGGGSVLQNSASEYADRAADKMIELYMACLAMKFAGQIRVDDPDRSRGDNPDVMFDFRAKRWALALKTVHSSKPPSVFAAVRKGGQQIEASSADRGLVVVNLKQVLGHERLWPPGGGWKSEAAAKAELAEQVNGLCRALTGEIVPADWLEVFGPGKRAALPVLFVAHASFYALPEHGLRPYPMLLKTLHAHPELREDEAGGLRLARALADAMQGLKASREAIGV